MPGVHLSTGEISLPGNATDSVDNDDGQLDHSGTQGHSLFSPNGAAGITFSFDPSGLGGSLPKRAGLVWTDGEGATMFEAFDSLGGSLGKIGPINIADSSLQGTDADDKFFGFIHQGGISKVTMSNTAGGIEVDHLQLEVNNLPHSGGSVGMPMHASQGTRPTESQPSYMVFHRTTTKELSPSCQPATLIGDR